VLMPERYGSATDRVNQRGIAVEGRLRCKP